MLFLTLAWRTRVPRVSDILLSSTRNTGFDSSARYEPCQTTNISSRFFFADGEKGATSVLGPQPIIWLLPSSSPPWSGDFVRATRCHPSQVTVNSNSSHPTSIVSVGYHVTLCWGFKGVQDEIHREEASTLQIGSVAFPAGQCTRPQLHPCHRLFGQDGHQDSSSPFQ